MKIAFSERAYNDLDNIISNAIVIGSADLDDYITWIQVEVLQHSLLNRLDVVELRKELEQAEMLRRKQELFSRIWKQIRKLLINDLMLAPDIDSEELDDRHIKYQIPLIHTFTEVVLCLDIVHYAQDLFVVDNVYVVT